MDLDLTGRSALVTGSWRGTGAIVAAHLAREGVRVFVHGFETAQATSAVAELGVGDPVSGDLCTDAGATSIYEQVCEQLGGDTDAVGLDILVNNYGTAAAGSWSSSDSADWIELYEKNVLSAQRLIRLFLPGMQRRGWGRVLNLGTVGSTRPNARMPHYYAAKGALANLTVGLAREVGDSGVGVNLISPGLILTPEVEAHYRRLAERKGWGESWEEIERHVARDIPLGRIARREEVADLVVFLASPRADAIQGQNLRIDGGQLGIVS